MSRIFFILLLLTMVHPPDCQAGGKKKHTSDTIHFIGHAHMDMNWLWTYFETLKMCNDNLRQAAAFMNEYPDFKMIQSQAAVYRFVEKVDPPLFDSLRKYVKEGRLEPAGGMWTEGDMNLSSGEAITRSFLLGQRYFQNHFGRMATVGWLPDNFGHISQMPQILKLAGCDYFYFTRCKPYMGTFWWTGPDASTVLCYANNGSGQRRLVPEQLKEELKQTVPGKHRMLYPLGLGDHGGGPTRKMIDQVHHLDKTPGFPAMRFTTAADFFRKASREMDGRPTHVGEMQFIFEGCYTTVAEIKEGNRSLENLLYAAEFFNTLRWLNGDPYPAAELRDIWTTVVFNQFHDILPGSAIYESNRQSIAQYTEGIRQTMELRDNAFRKMADEVQFNTGIGQPVVAFNLHPVRHTSIVEAEVYSHSEPFTIEMIGAGHYYGSNIHIVDRGQGNVPTIQVRDGAGKTYPAQISSENFAPPGYTSAIQFITDDIPPCGYKTFYLDISKPGEFNDPVPFNNNTFETDFFRITFDMSTGGIISLYDKRYNKEYVKEGGQLNRLRMYLEDRKGTMKSWTINKIVREEEVAHVSGAKVVETGPVRACVESVKTWGRSRFIERTYIYRSYPAIIYEMEVHWLETGSDTTDSPMLRALFPLAIDNPVFHCQVPFDVVERPTDLRKSPPSYKEFTPDWSVNDGPDGQEVPAQKWVDLTDGTTGIALLNSSKYGHSYHNGELRLTLLRSAGEPDIYPNLGKFNISYALFPHPGDWTNGVWEAGEYFNVPVYAAEPPSLALVKTHATRAEEDSFFSLDATGIALSGIKQSEDGNMLIVRLSEVAGKERSVRLTLPFHVRDAQRLNLIEFPLENKPAPTISGSSIQLMVKPHEIITLGITPDR